MVINQKKKNESVFSLLKRLIPFCKPYRMWIGYCLIVSIADMIISISEAYFVQNLVNAALGYEKQELGKNIVLMVGVVLVGIGVTYSMKYLYGFFSSSKLRDLRSFLVDHLQKQGIFDLENRHSGDLVSRMTGDIGILQNFIHKDFLEIFLEGILFFGATGYMATINWRLLLFSIMLTPLTLVVLHYINRPVRKRAKKALEYLGMAAAVLKDTIGGIYMMKAFNINSFLYEKYRRNVYGTLDMYLKNIRISVWTAPLHVTLRTIPRVLCVTYGGYLVANGRITPGELVSFLFLLGFATWPLAFLPELVNNTKTAMGAFERLTEIMDQPQERQGGCSFTDDLVQQMISFEDVSFAYHGEVMVLENLNFVLERGKKTALVGPSGSGKSTALKLICGSDQLKDGRIKVYEEDLNDWDLNSLRAQISLVSQDTFLFPTTILENIAYGKPSATGDEIIAAAKNANAHQFIMEFPDGYDSQVGERGIRLSGGQKQRISIARAILKDAPILLLDEPTSALDTYSESLVQEALNRVMQGRTVLIVAHRLSTIKDVDEVLVLDRGRIVERGTHGELMHDGSLYSQLYLRQFETGESA